MRKLSLFILILSSCSSPKLEEQNSNLEKLENYSKSFTPLYGKYENKIAGFYKYFIFKEHNVVIVEMPDKPITTSYILNGNTVKIKIDNYELIYKIKDNKTIVGTDSIHDTYIKLNSLVK